MAEFHHSSPVPSALPAGVLAAAPVLDGQLLTDDASLQWACRDFGGLIHHRPLAVLRPGSTTDIVQIMRFGTERGIPVVPRGQGHSLAGQAQCSNGIVIDMTTMNRVHEITEDRIVVEAGARWSQVLAATLPRGLTPPVLTDYLELTVGGTLSVGGIGGASHHFGAQTDNVLTMDIITPDGLLSTCSPEHNPGLFDRVRAGQGRNGVIVRATLRLAEAHTRALRYHLYYPDLPSMLADQRRLVADRRFDYLEGQIQLDENGNRRQHIEAATFFTPPAVPDPSTLLAGLSFQRGTEEAEELSYFDFLNRLAAAETLLRATGHWTRPHPWCNLLLPDTAIDHIAAEVAGHLTRENLGTNGVVLLYPLPRAAFTTPQLRVPNEKIFFLLALLRFPDSDLTIPHLREANKALSATAEATGGTAYLRPYDHNS